MILESILTTVAIAAILSLLSASLLMALGIGWCTYKFCTSKKMHLIVLVVLISLAVIELLTRVRGSVSFRVSLAARVLKLAHFYHTVVSDLNKDSLFDLHWMEMVIKFGAIRAYKELEKEGKVTDEIRELYAALDQPGKGGKATTP